AEKVNVFDALREHIDELVKERRRVFIACWTEGSADRMRAVLDEHGIDDVAHFERWTDAVAARGGVSTVLLGLETGFVTANAAFISEQDILGDRLVRRGRRKRAENFLTEASSLLVGDLVVHVDH